jgi:hypothetical protein
MRKSTWFLYAVICVFGLVACGYPSLASLGSSNDAGDNSDGGGRADNTIDARVCFGTNPVTICLEDAPIAPLTISSATMINTDDSTMCALVRSGGNYCVLAATTITINVTLRATGTRPLVLIASDSILIYGLIDVGSHRGAVPEIGAGADPANCVAGILPQSACGGAGGSFTGSGGNGGNVQQTLLGGVPGAVSTMTTELRGGCPGQDGQVSTAPVTNRGIGGHGGGAVHLIAGSTIDVRGAINAAGEGGGGACPISNCPGGAGTFGNGGGGGGSGGMIGFDAPIVTNSGLILANGGGGGSGGEDLAPPGRLGADPTVVTAAAGGLGTSSGSANGGNGSAGPMGGSGSTGGSSSARTGGGGGGGGGAGLVKSPTAANLGTQVSPSPTP